MVSVRNVVATQFWLDNSDLRNEKRSEILSNRPTCISCRKKMMWHSDHLNYIIFECTSSGCNGEAKVYL